MKHITFVAGVAVWVLAATGCQPTGSFKITALPADQTLQEEVVQRADRWTGNRVALIDITGVLMNAADNGLFSEGEHPVAFTVEKLTAAAADERVKAVVLRVNSPGGTVTASDTLFEEVARFRKTTGKPVVAYFQDVAASGAYYLSCAADEILAQRTSVTGSIGVVMLMPNFTGTMDKLGIGLDAITSGAMKDSGSPFRKMRPEERQLFQGLVDGFYGQFVDAVASGRPKLTRERIKELADGRVYSATQALENGLIDGVCTLPEAIKAAMALAKIDAAHVVRYHRPLSWSPNIYAQGGGGGSPTVNLVRIDLPFYWTKSPQFMYIWDVGN